MLPVILVPQPPQITPPIVGHMPFPGSLKLWLSLMPVATLQIYPNPLTQAEWAVGGGTEPLFHHPLYNSSSPVVISLRQILVASHVFVCCTCARCGLDCRPSAGNVVLHRSRFRRVTEILPGCIFHSSETEIPQLMTFTTASKAQHSFERHRFSCSTKLAARSQIAPAYAFPCSDLLKGIALFTKGFCRWL